MLDVVFLTALSLGCFIVLWRFDHKSETLVKLPEPKVFALVDIAGEEWVVAEVGFSSDGYQRRLILSLTPK